MNIIIEDLKYEDIEECYKLNMSIFNENSNLDEVKAIYCKYSEDKEAYRFIVAKLNGKIVGYMTCNITYNLFDGNYPIMTLWYVCTHPDYRRMGIATKMFDEIEKIAMDIKCSCICFTSKNHRADAHAFYEKRGYESSSSKAFFKYF